MAASASLALVVFLQVAFQSPDRGSFLQEVTPEALVSEALTRTDTETREELLRRADSVAAVQLEGDPRSADALYWTAASAGLLAETAGSREKIALGKRSMAYAERALELDPDHAGAHHVLGRIHAGVKKLGWLTRVVGRRLGMGPLLDAATWEEAEVHLRRARELEPDNLTFRLEYAVALRDMGREEDATAELVDLLRRPAEAPIELAASRRACRILVRMKGEGCPEAGADESGL